MTKRPKKQAAKYASVYNPDDGSHTKVRLMKDDAVRNPLCMDCGVDTDAINEQYMVLDEVWREGTRPRRECFALAALKSGWVANCAATISLATRNPFPMRECRYLTD